MRPQKKSEKELSKAKSAPEATREEILLPLIVAFPENQVEKSNSTKK